MKKIISILLVCFMVLSIPAFAFEENDTSKVLGAIKDRIPDTESYENFESSVMERNGEKVYHFFWRSEKEGYKEMTASATASGIILSYNFYEENRQKNEPTVNKPMAEEYLDKAKEFADKLNPTIKDSIEVSVNEGSESLYSREYTYNLSRKENGYYVNGNGGSITLTYDGESVRSYNFNYTEGVEFAKPEKVLTKDEVKEGYFNEIGMKLSYKTGYKEKERYAYLSYLPKEDYNTYIDALTGKAVTLTPYGGIYYNSSFREEAAALDKVAATGGANFSEAEIKEFEKLNGLISKEEAIKILNDTNLLIKEDKNPESFSTNRDYYDEEVYYYNIYFKDDDFYARAKINGKTGEIISLYQQDDYYKDMEAISTAEAKKAMDNALSILCNDKIKEGGEYRLEADEEYSRTYVRYVNDIPYDSDSIIISVSKKDGRVTNYSYNYTPVEFPSPEGIIGEKDAVYRLIEQKDYEPLYFIALEEDKTVNTYLVYMFNGGSYEIDAFTGDIMNNYEAEKIPEYKDIEGHYAEKAIKTLRRFGIGFAQEEFMPDKEISQKDYIALLTMAVVRNSGVIITKDFDSESTYNYAYNVGILEKGEKNDDALVSKMDAAIYFIRALELSRIAKMDEIYNCPFTDVSYNKGYVSILYGLGVVKGSGNNLFNPDSHITRGQAAIMIYNYLNK